MSRLYDTVEPAVIDDDMLQKAVEEQGPKEEAGKIAKDEGIDFAEVKALRLDFKNVLKIDNLWCFKTLTKLQLDNNIIEKIEGLDLLVNLIWLDLSFNNIEVVEGLDKLTHLEDLTLYNNRIQRLENMDALTNLHVFSIGNNDLKELDNLLYLRRFKQLQTLNLGGNPICTADEFRQYTIAYLPSIQFLDYRLVDEASKKAAFEKYENRVQELMHDEKQHERTEEARKQRDQELELHKLAYVELLNGPHLFESMYAEDAEGQKLNHMPNAEDMLVIYKEKFTQICQQVFDYGLEKHGEREKEVATFWECINEAKEENKAMGAAKIQEFMDYKKKLWQELGGLTDPAILEDKVADYNVKVNQLWEDLMCYEMQLVDQLEDAIKDFERNMADMVSTFIENVQGHTSGLRDLENGHHQKLEEIALTTLEKVVKNELDDDIPDDLRELFVDRDTISNAVTSSHDVHMLQIDNREDDIITRVNGWMSKLVEGCHEKEEVQRNRARVTEINNLIDHLRDEIDNFDLNHQEY